MEIIKQLTVEEMYITPLRERRVYNEDGIESWVAVKRNMEPTGQRHLDFIARSMSDGNTNLYRIARRMGCSYKDLCSLLRAMTGMSAHEFRRDYILRASDELLRYTTMSVDEVARRVGCYSASALSQYYRRFCNQSPKQRRMALRGDRDAGKYRV